MTIKYSFNNFSKLLIAFIFANVFHISYAGSQEDIELIQAKLASRVPPIKAKNIRPSPIADVYEVFVSGSILYTDKTFSYVIAGGNLIDATTMKSLTQERMKQLTAIKFDDLPLQNAIEIKKGSGAYKFAVFSDPDCPYCKSLENELIKSGVTDYTAYIFLYPLKNLHQASAAKAEHIWCNKDRAVAWSNYMLKNIQPDKKTCDNPLATNEMLAQALGVGGTPTIYLTNGEQAQDTSELILAINAKKTK